MASSFKANIPKYNVAVDYNDEKKNKKKKSLVSLFSHKLQKKIAKSLVNGFTEIAPTNTNLITDKPENDGNQKIDSYGHNNLTNQKVDHNDPGNNNSNKKIENNVHNNQKISSSSTENKVNDNEENKGKCKTIEKEKIQGEIPKPPVPPRISSNIPVRGSSSNYDINYYNSILFDKYSLSPSSAEINNDYKSNLKHKSLTLKRSNSDLTPKSSTENLSNINNINSKSTADLLKLNQDLISSYKSSFNSVITLVQDSNITLTLTDETLNEIDKKINRSDSSNSGSSSSGSSGSSGSSDFVNSSGSGSSSSSNYDSSNSNSSSLSSSSSENDKPVEEVINSEKFYFDEKRKNTIKKPIHSEKSRKINEIFRRESEKYMDQQLVDLCSTYYKDYYYGKLSNSNSSLDSLSGDTSDEKDKKEVSVPGKEKSQTDKKSKTDDEKSSSDSTDDENTYIVKSNSTYSYFNPNKTTGCDIVKSNSLPLNSKHMSQKIITCPSDDPNKPTTHLVNISGVTIQTNDLNHLFWVPSYLHPEVHPLELKKLMTTEANAKSNMFGRRLSIRRTKSYAESARVITPENITENGEPVMNQIQRHKTFDTIQSLKKNQRSNNFKPLKKSSLVEEVKEIKSDDIEDLNVKNDSEKTVPNDNEIVTSKDNINENDKDIIIDDQSSVLRQQDETVEPKLLIDTSKYYPHEPLENHSPISNDSLIEPSHPLDLQQSSSTIPYGPSEESTTPINDESMNETDNEQLSPKIFLPNANDDKENIPLVHGSYKAENENVQPKSGWSLWWSSFGKDDKKEVETKKNKRNSVSSPKSPFAFFRIKSSSSIADKNINYRQGKGTIKAYLLTSPLIFKPLTREAEDTIYSLSHKKLATTYRPMAQQVYINNIMQRYIRKYKDSAYIIPFKTVRPPKKRRTLPKQPLNNAVSNPSPSLQKNQQNPNNTIESNNYNSLNEPIGTRIDSKKKKHTKKNTKRKQKLVNIDESKLDQLLERGIEYEDINTKKPKRRTKVKTYYTYNDEFSKKNVKSVYKNLNHSISMDQLSSTSSTSTSSRNLNKYKGNSPNMDYRNYYYSSGTSSSEDDDEDDEIPLAMLRNKRSSIITI